MKLLHIKGKMSMRGRCICSAWHEYCRLVQLFISSFLYKFIVTDF